MASQIPKTSSVDGLRLIGQISREIVAAEKNKSLFTQQKVTTWQETLSSLPDSLQEFVEPLAEKIEQLSQQILNNTS